MADGSTIEYDSDISWDDDGTPTVKGYYTVTDTDGNTTIYYEDADNATLTEDTFSYTAPGASGIILYTKDDGAADGFSLWHLAVVDETMLAPAPLW